jgi:hypothetical protein
MSFQNLNFFFLKIIEVQIDLVNPQDYWRVI